MLVPPPSLPLVILNEVKNLVPCFSIGTSITGNMILFCEILRSAQNDNGGWVRLSDIPLLASQ
jgi:hypothetical protein